MQIEILKCFVYSKITDTGFDGSEYHFACRVIYNEILVFFYHLKPDGRKPILEALAL